LGEENSALDRLEELRQLYPSGPVHDEYFAKARNGIMASIKAKDHQGVVTYLRNIREDLKNRVSEVPVDGLDRLEELQQLYPSGPEDQEYFARARTDIMTANKNKDYRGGRDTHQRCREALEELSSRGPAARLRPFEGARSLVT